ncbi:hypothetical protein ACWD4B_26720 [Streptomyces sp. NPDC002536]
MASGFSRTVVGRISSVFITSALPGNCRPPVCRRNVPECAWCRAYRVSGSGEALSIVPLGIIDRDKGGAAAGDPFEEGRLNG